MLKQTFSKPKPPAKKAARDELSGPTRVYDAALGRWLIDGKVPSDD